MYNQTGQDTMLDIYILETALLIEQLEQIMIKSEQSSCFKQININEMFCRMHTIKGLSAMMQYTGITNLAHSMEDIFWFLIEEKPKDIDFTVLTDLMFTGIEYIKIEIEKIKDNITEMGTAKLLISSCKDYLDFLKSGADLTRKGDKIDYIKTASSQRQLTGLPETTNGKHRFREVIYFSDG